MKSQVNIEPSWQEKLQGEFDKDYFVGLTRFVHEEYSHYRCYPPGNEIFNAFNLCPFDKVRVVIIGQDPYHGAGQAEGLCFSVKTGIPLPPSLVNIFKEIKDDIGTVPQIIEDANGRKLYDGSLRRWAEQGVLLLNATLTVREHVAASHQRKDGRSSRMPSSRPSPVNAHMLSSCFGAAMRATRSVSSTGRSTSFLSPSTRLPSPPTVADGSETTISPVATNG